MGTQRSLNSVKAESWNCNVACLLAGFLKMFWLDRHTKFALFLGVILNQGIFIFLFFSWFIIVLKKNAFFKIKKKKPGDGVLNYRCHVLSTKKSKTVIKQSWKKKCSCCIKAELVWICQSKLIPQSCSGEWSTSRTPRWLKLRAKDSDGKLTIQRSVGVLERNVQRSAGVLECDSEPVMWTWALSRYESLMIIIIAKDEILCRIEAPPTDHQQGVALDCI